MRLIVLILLGLLLFSILTINNVSGEKISTLIRLHKGDTWIYETSEGLIQYNVSDTFVYRNNKEVNMIMHNSTNPQVPISKWVDDRYFFINETTGVHEERDDCVFIAIEMTNLSDFFSIIGNYWQGCNGKAKITVRFSDRTFIFNRTGDLWVNTKKSGNISRAIAMGETQIEYVEFDYHYVEKHEDYDSIISMYIEASYSITPCSPYLTTWEGEEVTAVLLSERLRKFSISIYLDHITKETSYRYSYTFTKEHYAQNKYIYAMEIGLPIEINRSLFIDGEELALGDDPKQRNSYEVLVAYDIEKPITVNETVNESTIIGSKETNTTPFSLLPLSIVVTVICLKRKRKSLS